VASPRFSDGRLAAAPGQPVDALSLLGPGPGEELVAHLAPVLADLHPSNPDEDGDSAAPSGGQHRALPRDEAADLLALFDAQAGSRWLDVAARRMRATSGVGGTGRAAPAAVGSTPQRRSPHCMLGPMVSA